MKLESQIVQLEFKLCVLLLLSLLLERCATMSRGPDGLAAAKVR